MPLVVSPGVHQEPAYTAPWVGAYVGDQANPSPDYNALWKARQREVGPLHIWRCFDSSIKTPATARYQRVPAPVIPFYSLKPTNGDITGFAAGNYSAAYQTVVSGLPYGSYLAVWHEPEDDMTGTDFKLLTERAYADAKAVRPDITFSYIAMAYQWETNSKGHTGSNAGWLEAARLVDLVAVDVYAPAEDYKPMAQDLGFQSWMTQIVAASGTPWGVTERGIYDGQGDTSRADVLTEDWLYACHNGAEMFLYYDADWDGGTYLLDGPASLAAMRGIAAQGRCR